MIEYLISSTLVYVTLSLTSKMDYSTTLGSNDSKHYYCSNPTRLGHICRFFGSLYICYIPPEMIWVALYICTVGIFDSHDEIPLRKLVLLVS